MGWLTGWNFRKSHTLTGSVGGAQVLYQVGIKVYFGAGVDGTEVINGVTFGKVYVNGKCQVDFDDIRFTETDGTTLLDYWIESKIDSNNAVIWVEVDSIPINPNTDVIYMYYGNDAVATTSDGDATFIFFDHFPGAALDTNKWDGDEAFASVAGSLMTLTGDDDWKRIYGLTEETIPFAFTALAQMEGYRNTIGVRDPTTADWCDIAFGSTPGVSEVRSSKAGSLTNNASNAAVTQKVFRITMEADEISYYENGVEMNGSPIADDIPIVDMPILFYVWEGDGTRDVIVDYCFLHEFVEPEPAHTSWGLEEGGFDSEELLGIFDIRKSDSEELLGIFSARRDGSAELLGIFTSRQADSESLLGVFKVRRDGSQELFAEFFAEAVYGSVELAAEFYIDDTHSITGITKDTAGARLGNCEVALFRVEAGNPPTYTFIEAGTSDGNGDYTFTGLTTRRFFVRGQKDGSPKVFDTTDNELEPV